MVLFHCRRQTNMINMAATLLLIQNPDSEHHELISHFNSLHYNLRTTEDVSSAIQLIDDNGVRPSAILVDIPDLSEEQMDMLESIGETLGIHEWVFLTYDLSPELSERLEELSYQSLKQPCSEKRVEVTVKKAIRSVMVRRRLAEYSANNLKKSSFDSIVGKSKVVLEHKKALKELSNVPMSTLMINGETGSGKGHAAGILHSNGLRKDHAFIEMNCAALPRDLVESQLFGHEAGAFTGAKGRHRGLLEQADNGTLFLDEIGEMPLDVQAKLLKAIEEQRFRRVGGEHLITVDVQIFAASNQNLEKMVVEGDFRQDLYHRLNVFQIEVPALREYKSDLIELVPLIIADLNAKSGKKVGVISDQAWRDLMDYEWPGNIRELRNALERGVLLAQNDTLNTSWLKLNNNLLVDQLDAGVVVDQAAVERRPDNVAQLNVVKSNQLSFTLDGKTSLEDMDRKIIETALKVSQQNISKAADLIGATRETLRYRIQKYELDVGADSA